MSTIETIPMATGSDGVIRVGGKRVTLDSILSAFNEGATPEGIAQHYPTAPLADIALLAWAAAQNRVLITHDVSTVTASPRSQRRTHARRV
jgi:uncharacterized protein (DUF433 family)